MHYIVTITLNTFADISIIKTKTHRSKKSVFSVTCVTASSPDISKDVSSRLREASQITPTSGTADSAKSPLWTTKMPLATDEPFSLSFPPQVPMRDPILNFETVSRAEPINSKLSHDICHMVVLKATCPSIDLRQYR